MPRTPRPPLPTALSAPPHLAHWLALAEARAVCLTPALHAARPQRRILAWAVLAAHRGIRIDQRRLIDAQREAGLA